MPATRKPLYLVLLALTGCGKFADDLFCAPEGCAWSEGEWARVASLAHPGPPPPDPSNEVLGNSAAELLGQAFFFDPAFSGNASELDAINRPSPPARAPKCEPIKVSCASCHDLAQAGVDTMSAPGYVSVGAGWTDVNALGVVNSAYRPVVFWNGRADSLWALNAVVAESPTTMNGNRLRTAHQIADRYAPFYDGVFAEAFLPLDIAAINALPANGKPKTPEFDNLSGNSSPDPDHPSLEQANPKAMVTRILVNWAKAIAAYEYKLLSVESPFDRFVREGPDSSAISSAAKRGARLFVGKGACIDCHAGSQLTDDQFHNIGVPQVGRAVPILEDCPASSDPANAFCDCVDTDSLKCAPFGAYDGLKRLRDTRDASPTQNRWLRTGGWSHDKNDHSRDAYVQRELTDDLKGAWRTPSLRNVALTAPYMHDGLYTTLEEVVWHYNTGGRNAGGELVNPDGLAPEIRPMLLSDGEVADLVAFLRTLTGETLPAELTAAPQGVSLPTGIGGAGGSCGSGAGGGSGMSGAGGGAAGTGGAGPASTGVGGSAVTGFGGAGGAGGAMGTGGAAGRALACSTMPLQSPLITDFSEDALGAATAQRFGRPPGITGRFVADASPGLMPPGIYLVSVPSGTPAMQVLAGATAPPPLGNSWIRAALSFDNCVDATGFNAIRFHFSSQSPTGNCTVRVGVRSRQNVGRADDPRSICPDASCYPPSMLLPVVQNTTITIPFVGAPLAGNPDLVDAQALIGLQWQMDVPPGSGCGTMFLVDDITFVNQ